MVMAQTLDSILSVLRRITLWALILGFVGWNIGAINQAAVTLLSMVSRIQQLEATGLKVILKDEKNVKAGLSYLKEAKIPEYIRNYIFNSIKDLKGYQLDRLFTLEQDKTHCIYTRPDPDMRLYMVADAELAQAGLVETKSNEEELAKKLSLATSEPSNIGNPVSCYNMRLTELGYKTKSVLVGIIRQAFD